ncbi:MAG: hypothetical protein PHP92_05200 [Candidatus Nanoarchaeia archaeon]|nr:hypothetical protein [Candidatus Nanoarchaeia archaeon]
MKELIEYVTSSGTFRIIKILLYNHWTLLLFVIIISGLLSKKEDNFIPLSKIKGFIKK